MTPQHSHHPFAGGGHAGGSSELFPDRPQGDITVTVGRERGDIRGDDQRALQAACDYVAGLGGGSVLVQPGVYTVHDSLRLRSWVRLVGDGDGVVLRKSEGFQVPLRIDGDYGEAQVQVDEPGRWRPGMGLTLGDERTHGFLVTVATVVAVEGGVLRLGGRIHGGDLLAARDAWAAHTFPVISAVGVQEAVVENLTVDGNRASNPPINGCVGGGIYSFRSRAVTIAHCRVADFNGDGISFQTSHDVIVRHCEVTGCSGHGLHPGSGSQRAKVLSCRSTDNDGAGLYVCWRVQHGRFADNDLSRNRQGVSIGHKDTDNLFERNTIEQNHEDGVRLRSEPEPLAAHRNAFRDNRICDNGGCGVRIEGVTRELSFENNTIRSTNGRQTTGVWIGPETDKVVLWGNIFEGHRDADVVRAGDGG